VISNQQNNGRKGPSFIRVSQMVTVLATAASSGRVWWSVYVHCLKFKRAVHARRQAAVHLRQADQETGYRGCVC
jgi:hypothetical protein